jgi:hypothetical protein
MTPSGIVTEMSTRLISWGVKAAGARTDNLTTYLWILSLLEPSWPIQAYTGIIIIIIIQFLVIM